ncbi:MAG: cyclic nucleotide-binding domain-containing protein [Actinobacteria bacterium]|nr:cyclic nucleotide-binding domain-containing protein [Actinomycetota bacterium]
MFQAVDPKIERLRTVRLFANLHDGDVRRIGRLVSEVERPAGTILIEEDAYGAEAFIIQSGTVRLEHDGVLLTRLGAGEIVGEFALIDQRPRSATAVAETDVALLVLSTREFDRLVDEVPAIARRLLAVLAGRVRAANHALDRT